MLPEHLWFPSKRNRVTKNISDGLWLSPSDILSALDLLWIVCNIREPRCLSGSSKSRQLLKPNKISWNWRFPKIKNSMALEILFFRFKKSWLFFFFKFLIGTRSGFKSQLYYFQALLYDELLYIWVSLSIKIKTIATIWHVYGESKA